MKMKTRLNYTYWFCQSVSLFTVLHLFCNDITYVELILLLIKESIVTDLYGCPDLSYWTKRKLRLDVLLMCTQPSLLASGVSEKTVTQK